MAQINILEYLPFVHVEETGYWFVMGGQRIEGPLAAKEEYTLPVGKRHAARELYFSGLFNFPQINADTTAGCYSFQYNDQTYGQLDIKPAYVAWYHGLYHMFQVYDWSPEELKLLRKIKKGK